jgi:hypothetical protein
MELLFLCNTAQCGTAVTTDGGGTLPVVCADGSCVDGNCVCTVDANGATEPAVTCGTAFPDSNFLLAFCGK